MSEQKIHSLFQKMSSILPTFSHWIIEVANTLHLLRLKLKYVYIRERCITHDISLRLMRMEGSGIYSQIADDIIFPSVPCLSVLSHYIPLKEGTVLCVQVAP